MKVWSRKSGRELVADPENPGKQVSASALRGRKRDRQLVADPENPGKQKAVIE